MWLAVQGNRKSESQRKHPPWGYGKFRFPMFVMETRRKIVFRFRASRLKECAAFIIKVDIQAKLEKCKVTKIFFIKTCTHVSVHVSLHATHQGPI